MTEIETLEYAPGRLADVSGDTSRQPVLIWHGKQPDARAVVRPLADLVTRHGLAVTVPDWDSRAADGGRADLLASVRLTRDRTAEPDRLLLVGWSLGGLAAAELTVQADRYGLRFAHTLCLAGAFMLAGPFSGQSLDERPEPRRSGAQPASRTPFTLLHGIADTVVPVPASREFAAVLERNGWPVRLIELAADHANIAGAEHDPAADRYTAGEQGKTLEVAKRVAAHIAAIADPPAG